jgi:hypothetical protein
MTPPPKSPVTFPNLLETGCKAGQGVGAPDRAGAGVSTGCTSTNWRSRY